MMAVPRVFNQKLDVSSTPIPLAEKAETEHTGQGLTARCGPYEGLRVLFQIGNRELVSTQQPDIFAISYY